MIIHQIALFREGKKRSLLLNYKQEGFDYLSQEYMFIPLSYVNKANNFKINLRFFVKTAEDADFFLKNVKLKTEDPYALPYDERLMGEILGIPPVAIEDYLHVPYTERVGVEYHGLPYAVRPENVDESIDYLKRNLPVEQSFIEKHKTCIYIFERNGIVREYPTDTSNT